MDCRFVNESTAGDMAPSRSLEFTVRLLPIVPAFLEAYPKLSLEISLTDQVIDLLEQRTDVALRSGPLKSSQLIARKLGAVRMMIVGSPGYFARYGVPKTPDELAQHNRLGFSYARAAGEMSFREQVSIFKKAPQKLSEYLELV